MGLISVRLDDEDERFLRKNRLSISKVVRESVHARIQQMRALDAMEFLASVPSTSGEPAQDTIRRLRDGRSLRP